MVVAVPFRFAFFNPFEARNPMLAFRRVRTIAVTAAMMMSTACGTARAYATPGGSPPPVVAAHSAGDGHGDSGAAASARSKTVRVLLIVAVVVVAALALMIAAASDGAYGAQPGTQP